MNLVTTLLILASVTIAIVVVAALHEKKRNAKRKLDIETEASELGLSFAPTDTLGITNRVANFQLFNKGRDKKVLNAVVGETDQIGITIFDYHYTTGSGEHTQKHRISVALMESPEFLVPQFTLRPENMFDKLGSVFGLQDIDFDSHPEFSKQYLLKSDDEDRVREFFDDAILGTLETRKNLCVESESGKMIVYYSMSNPKASQLKTLFAEALEIYGVFDDRIKSIRT